MVCYIFYFLFFILWKCWSNVVVVMILEQTSHVKAVVISLSRLLCFTWIISYSHAPASAFSCHVMFVLVSFVFFIYTGDYFFLFKVTSLILISLKQMVRASQWLAIRLYLDLCLYY